MTRRTSKLFESFFIGGFECSTHRRKVDRKRLDMIAATEHERYVHEDYARLQAHCIRTAREGVRWHLVEKSPGVYDFTSLLPIIRAARETHTQVIWDLFHYGYPDDIDIFAPHFITRFVRLAREFARLLKDETDTAPFVAPVNEISFYSWAAAQVGFFHPFARARGDELKAQLVRAAIAATEELWAVNAQTRIAQIDPAINVIARNPRDARQRRTAENYRLAQFAAWDTLGGRIRPEIGGAEKYLDIIGVNFYSYNQWQHGGATIDRSDVRYRPFREMLAEIHKRYHRPIFIAETGIEDSARPAWLAYIGEEARAAISAGVDLQGICLYPILNHPGWDDERHCHNGLWDYADERGERAIYQPLADELSRQQALFPQMNVQETEGS
ncbi:MAG: beta-glucosidase [Acidobacteriota bacterium]|nr:beta-glucosidase [Acidobacteriota bacterium]